MVMFQAQNRETTKYKYLYLKSCCVLQDHDDERYKIVFHKTTPELRPRPVFWSEAGLVLRPTVSDHITGVCVSMQNMAASTVYEISGHI